VSEQSRKIAKTNTASFPSYVGNWASGRLSWKQLQSESTNGDQGSGMTMIQHLSKMESANLEVSDVQNGDRKALTPRQLQLIRLVADGLTNKEIAASLNLSQFTVKNPIHRVMRRVEAASRHDAVHTHVRFTSPHFPRWGKAFERWL